MHRILTKTLFFMFITLTSCHFPTYKVQGTKNAQLDFSKGNWLLADINTSSENNNVLEKLANKSFETLLKERLTMQYEAKGLMVSPKVNLENIETHLKDFKNNQPYDYLIFIEAKIFKNDMGNLVIGQTVGPEENKTSVTLNVYDLNLKTQIYSQTVVGVLIIQDDSQDVSFAKSADKMLQNCLKRILKKMNKHKK